MSDRLIDALKAAGAPPLRFGYSNHRGEYAVRSAYPVSAQWTVSDWHPEPQWIIEAFDTEKGAMRSFAMRDMSMAPEGIRPLGREELRELVDLVDAVDKALRELPHKVAQPQLENLDAIRNTLLETLPGGFADYCEGCGMPLGEKEVAARDTENALSFCAKCAGPAEPTAPDEDGWIAWAGGDCPVDPEALVAVRWAAGGEDGPFGARGLRWAHENGGGDVVAYRVVLPDTPPAPSPEGDRLRAEAAALLEASGNAATTDDAIELRMDAARSEEAADRADVAAAAAVEGEPIPDPVPAAPVWIEWAAPKYEGKEIELPVDPKGSVYIRVGSGLEIGPVEAGAYTWTRLRPIEPIDQPGQYEIVAYRPTDEPPLR